jgi:hypothetical protein
MQPVWIKHKNKVHDVMWVEREWWYFQYHVHIELLNSCTWMSNDILEPKRASKCAMQQSDNKFLSICIFWEQPYISLIENQIIKGNIREK